MAQISDHPITAAQIRLIHVTLHRRGIDDDTYRAMLRTRFRVGTCKDLTRRQAHDLLSTLGMRLRTPPGAKSEPRPRRARSSKKLPPNVIAMVTPAQRHLIEELSQEIEWREADGYARWLRVNMGLKRVTTVRQAASVIEGLKGIKAGQRKAQG